MTNPCRDGAVDRLDYVEGARLLADDLGDSRGVEARWQALHVRGLHDTWGVATGLLLTRAAAGRVIRISAGAAFDCRGNVLELRETVELPAPTGAAPGLLIPTFDLVLGTRGVRWEPTGGQGSHPGYGPGVRFGLDVPLGRFVRGIWGTLSEPDMGFRRVAHPVTRPRIGFGMTPLGGLSWSARSTGIRAVIDTSSERFTSTPRYVGWLSHTPAIAGLIGPFLSLSSFYPDRFSVQVSGCATNGLSATAMVATLMAESTAIRIAWMGVESFAGCARGNPGGFV